MRRLFVPLTPLFAVLAMDRGWLGTLSTSWLTPTLCAIVFALVFLLAWRFRRGRIALAVVAFGWAVAGGWHWGQVLDAAEPAVQDLAIVLVTTALASVLGLLPWLHEWRVATPAGLLRLGGLGLVAVAVRWSLAVPETRPWLTASTPFDLALPLLPLPPLACLALLLAGVSLLTAFLRRAQPFEAGLLAVWMATGLAALAAADAPGGTGLADAALPYLFVGGVILGTSLLEGAFSLAFEDGLTGLPARRSLEESLLQLGSRYTLAMVDIDHFKKLNDRHGHEVGDQVLRMVAQLLRSVGGGGEAYRYGGEEFTLLFPGKGIAEVEPHLETLRSQIAQRRFEVRSPARPTGKGSKASQGRGKGGQGKTVRVTVSLGVAQRSPRLRTPETVMKAADKALYRSKKNGRNRLTAAK